MTPPGEGDWIDLSCEALDAGAAVAFASTPEAGGVALFVGCTREERRGDGVALAALEYEAYEAMALRQLRDLAGEARRRWPIARLALLHRLGRVGLGEASVLVAVSCPHRGEAFTACRWLIDALKADAAIWKREAWTDERRTWVGVPPTPPG